MKIRTARRHVAAAGFFLAALSSAAPLLAQAVRVNIPGVAFEAEGNQATVDDVAGGRRFRGQAFATVVVRAAIQMPASGIADPKMQRLVIRFRTSPSGPSLRSVALHNGSSRVFHREINASGDYTGRETTAPDRLANTWEFGPITMGSQSVVRLEVAFPGGFDSSVNSGEFVLAGVTADFPRKGLTSTSAVIPAARAGSIGGGTTSARLELPAHRAASVPATSAAGVIYAVAANNDLLWYRHTGREDGTINWAASAAKTVGTGWGFRQVFPGDAGEIYAITSSGELLWYRHDGRGDGSMRWAANTGTKVGEGWLFERVFSGGGGVIYAITSTGDLLWYRHDGHADGSMRWAANAGKKVGQGWSFEHVFAGENGVLYAITADAELLWYRHEGRDDGSFRWAASEGKKVGTGWAVRQAFSAGDGVIYAVMENGDLLWNRHEGRNDGSFRWTASNGKKVGTGWIFADVF